MAAMKTLDVARYVKALDEADAAMEKLEALTGEILTRYGDPLCVGHVRNTGMNVVQMRRCLGQMKSVIRK